ncbi:MAG: hypothetical protein JXB62_03615 [Pirellulales bacterium]|nr:hypothetical protein [Pirellulales bacterium]
MLLSARATGDVDTASTDILYNQLRPEVAMAPSGNSVVVWDALSGADSDIFFQLLDAYGNPVFTEQQFARATSDNETDADVAVDASGNFVVVWTRSNVDGSGSNDVLFQRFDSSGNRVGSVTVVSTADDVSTHQNARVAMADDGSFVVTWQRKLGSRSWEVNFRRFDSSGTAETDEDQVAAGNTSLDETEPDIAIASDTNDFVIAWTEQPVGGGDRDVYFRIFNADGTERKARTQANTTDGGRNQYASSVAVGADGNFAITWTNATSAREDDVFLQQFTSKGVVRGPEVLVDTRSGRQTASNVSMSADRIVVTYQDVPLRDFDVFFAQFSADASTTARGKPRSVQRPTTSIKHDLFLPSVAMNASGGFVMAWQYSPAAVLDSIQIRSFRDDAKTPGLYDPATSLFLLRNANTTGTADLQLAYGAGGAGLVPIAGDWDGDGLATIGLYDPTTSQFLLRNSNDAGFADLDFVYGAGGVGLLPVIGDWDGDGIDTVGLYDPADSRFLLRNSNNAGFANLNFIYGAGGAGLQPIAGDFDGNGIGSIGLYDPATSLFMLRNSNDTGVADREFAYGAGGAGSTPLAGDWNRDGTDTIGLYDPAVSALLLRNTNTTGYADLNFVYGAGGAGLLPIVGDWNGPGALPLLAAGGEATAGAQAGVLADEQLRPIVAEAVARWEAAAPQADLAAVDFVIADLPGATLGLSESDTIYLDRDAAGYGWFVDPTPADDEEFAFGSGAESAVVDPSAADRMDLLTVVAHELGHVLGLPDLGSQPGSLMSGLLSPGLRREPTAAQIGEVFAGW